MNVPFPPLLLWPVVIGIVVCAILWRRWQKRAFLAAPVEDWPKHAPRGWKHARGYPWVLAVAGLLGAYSLWRFSAPSIHGVVLDVATGQGVPEATVARKVFRSAQVSLTEGPGVFTEPWSRVQTRTDSQGRFRLPGYVSLLPFGIRGECGMAWKVFAPGYIAAGGCERKGFPADDGCGPDGAYSYPDPWVATNSKRGVGSFRLEIRVSRPQTAAGDPWGEYFRRLDLLVQYRYLNKDQFIQEAVNYVERHPPTEGMMLPIGSLVPSGPCDTPYCRDPRIRRLTKAIVEYCDDAPNSEYCRPRRGQMIQRLREWLEADTRDE
jgi:hypothetical protein